MQTSFLSDPCSLPRNLHHVGAPEQPIHAHVEPVCNLTHAVEIEGAQAYEMHIERAPAANADASADGIACGAANAAGFGEALAE